MGDGGGRFPPEILTAVAVDKDKNSQHAVKWTVDHLLINTPRITLIHVRPPSTSGTYGLTGGFSVTEASPEAAQEQIDWETDEFFLPYRGFCARKGMQLKEVIMEDTDVSRAIVDYITANNVQNIVVGTSNRNALTRKFRNPDVPSLLLKAVPDFCTVYVISKGKAITVRSAKIAAPTKQASIQDQASPRRMPPPDHEDSVRAPRGALRGSAPATLLQPERVSFERFSSPRGKMVPTRDSRPVPSARSPRKNYFDGLDGSTRPPRLSDSCFSEEGECFPESLGSMDFRNSLEFSYASAESPPRTSSSASAASRDVEEEMRRLKLELKQTMDMYSTACKEAITAKQKAKELHQWKVEESRKFEELRSAEGAALAMAEMEKAKCKVAIEAAMAAQRIAELEAQKRINVERKAKLEEEEKKKALDALAHTTDIRYRKYTIEEIEAATENFVESLKIGEGGYGPVYRACLDHTPVAIKILRPDAAQGREQFQQEVEVLSCIRHPNMVLLLGACPENGCLVYEYMENGSLDDRLFRRGNTPTIPWSVRFRIAAEIATGLLFLHQTKPEPLVHRDLKPANILLDRNYTSKISDVGLARLVPPSVADTVTQYRMTSAAGTFCYIDPEYQQTGMLGTKSDVYSLGIMLLQIITAKPPMGLTHHVERAIERGRFEEMLDQTVTDWPVEEALAFAKLALKCAELRRKDRPDLGMVVLPELNRLRNLGHACAEHNSGSTGCGFSGPRAYNSQLQAPGTRTSTLGQEQQRSEPNGRPQWMSAPDT